MYIPSSTYRIQFNNQFTFKNLVDQLQYLTSLGIGAIYASPVFAAVPGSNHGYDVTNPLIFNKEIANSDEFEGVSNFLKSKSIGWIQDIVPNHMAFHPDNVWLMDVLEKGKQSAYAGYFDIDWEHPVFKDKVMVPILGKNPEQAVNDGEIKLIWQDGGFFVSYYDFKIPASGESFHELLEESKELEGSFYVGQGIKSDEFKADPAFKDFGWSNSRERFQAIYETDNSFETFIDNICEEINSDSTRLLELLDKQHFVLTHWQEVEKHLNYRRFFTINGLICLSMEKTNVFEDYHSFIYENVKSGKFQGLRIDHVDGLKSPNMYFDRLRAKMGDDTYIVAEKILEHNEELQKDWPLQGSSGYDFLAIVNNLFTNRSAYHTLSNFYNELTGNNLDVEEIIYQKKKMILTQNFSGDWDNICRKIEDSGLVTYNNKITSVNLRDAVGEFLINTPVYKLYSDKLPLEPDDAKTVQEIIDKSIQKTPHLSAPLKVLRDIFLGDYADTSHKDWGLEIFLKCMQYTGPLMAKGVEDTTMYTWSAFIAHNEVGDAVNAAGISIEDFHKRMIDRRNHYPHSINATATHDTKRGEDSRARLNVISDFSSEWMQLVKHWLSKTHHLTSSPVHHLPTSPPHQFTSSPPHLTTSPSVPDVNEQYFIYQTLAGAMPMDGNPDPTLPERLTIYFQKALREAKIHSNWNKPDETYEKAVSDFTKKLLHNNVMPGFHEFLKNIIPFGIVNSLSQVVLKCTCPGIPDFYQGTELWDLSLVDPDNRRPVDYKKRDSSLTELKALQLVQKENFFSRLLESKEDGRIKLWLAHKLMLERSSRSELFTSADYVPLEIKGEFKNHILAFARTTKKVWYLTIVPLHTSRLPRIKDKHIIDWQNTSIELPQNAPKEWKLLWDESLISSDNDLTVAKALKYDCPAVFKGEITQTGRGSGILLHITSLPGKYGTGDLGEEAYRFVDFLKQTNQSYWQVLPFNPVGSSFSPYSSSSAFGGNTTFIDPEDLYKRRLLKTPPERITETNSADFIKAENLRNIMIEEAFNSYVNQNSPLVQKRFGDFCTNEQYWLNDFALYNVFKNVFENKPWNAWPRKIKTRDKESLAISEEKFASDITKIKFGQYLFSEQFKKLKMYANNNGIKIIGDMPIYVSYESSDVWANPELFDLDTELKMKTVAGVPPDYFSKTGQLWNMPLYNWSKMESDGYSWWKSRIRKNLEYCDMLRFDHFRGFSSYWEVPAGEITAVKGEWIKGPGNKFFANLKDAFPEMPFIAEDLGDIDADVYKLRDDFKLPGMKVLQFAFGDNMPVSVHIPHMHTTNSIVYTGTHDNNTIKGWYKKEVNRIIKSQIKEYLNKKVNTSNISEEIIRLAFSSVGRVVIIPVQDILDLDEIARFNNPSQPEGNWTWKLRTSDLKPENLKMLKNLTELYGRIT